jgi:PAS domain S-box-containing protein
LKISWGDNKYGAGPTGTAIRTSKNAISRNILEDPKFAVWREEALARGFNSSIALPIVLEDTAIGSLNIYSSEVDSFDPEELELLEELSADISFALESMQNRKERYKAIEKLKESEISLKSVIDAAPYGAHSYQLNKDGKLIFTGANKSANTILGIDHELLIGKEIKDAFPGLVGTDIPKIYRKIAIHGGEHREDRVEYDAESIVGIFEIVAVNTGKNRMSVFFRDITEAKKAENALKESEERFRLLAENSQDLIYRMSLPEGEYEYVSPSSERIMGYTPEDIYNTPMLVRKIIHPDWVDYFQKEWEKLLKGDMAPFYEYQIIDKNGNKKWVNQRNSLIKDKEGHPKYIQGILTDITERKNMEEQLKKSEKRYRNIFENSMEGIYQSTPEGKYISVNPAFAQMAGFESPEEMISKVHDINKLYVNPDQRKEVKRILSKEGVLKDFEIEVLHQKGHVIWMSIYAKAIKDDEDHILYYEGTAQDITGKKLMTEALRKSEEKYRNIVEAANEGIWAMDENYLTTFVNQRMTEILGYDSKEMLGQPVTNFIFEEDLEDHSEHMKGRIKGLSDQYNRRFRRKDGDEVWTLVSATALKDEKGEFSGSFALFTDITNIKKKEAHLEKALDEKELLLREVHHRVKNNMQIVTSLLSLQADYSDNQDSIDTLTESQNRVKSMSFIYENLYQSENLLEIDFSEYVKKLASSLLYTYIHEQDRVIMNFHMQKLFLNIDTAIPCGLIINELVTNSLKHGFPHGRNGEIDIGLKQEGKNFYLQVKDNGVGLPENLDFKKSRTLGLQLVISLVKQIDGEIKLSKEKETCFQVKFKEITYSQRI